MNASRPDFAVYLPHPTLRPYVARYTSFRADSLVPGAHDGLPNRHILLVLSLDAPIDILRMPGAAQAPAALTTHARQYAGEKDCEETWLEPPIFPRAFSCRTRRPTEDRRAHFPLRARDVGTAVEARLSIVQAAAECGYYDQSHMTADWKKLARLHATHMAGGGVSIFQDRGLLQEDSWL